MFSQDINDSQFQDSIQDSIQDSHPVDFEREVIKTSFGKQLFVDGNIVDVSDLHDIVNALDEGQREFVQFYYKINNNTYSPDEVLDAFDWYTNLLLHGCSMAELLKHREKYNIVRYFLHPLDLHEHFKQYPPYSLTDETVQFEREQAIKALTGQEKGSWLIRHSSYNRSTATSKTARYYALSYVFDVGASKMSNDSVATIYHVLFCQEVGVGWFFNNVRYDCFVDCLEAMLKYNKIPYNGIIFKYC
jgi:hypothetical protein